MGILEKNLEKFLSGWAPGGPGQPSAGIQARIAAAEKSIPSQRAAVAAAEVAHQHVVDNDEDPAAIRKSRGNLDAARAYLTDLEGKLGRLNDQLATAVAAETAAAVEERLKPLPMIVRQAGDIEGKIESHFIALADLLVEHHGVSAHARHLNALAETAGRRDLMVRQPRDLTGLPIISLEPSGTISGGHKVHHPVGFVVDKTTWKARRASDAG